MRESELLKLTIKLPSWLKILGQRLMDQTGANHFYWDRIFFQYGIVKFAIAHLPGFDQLLMKRADLQTAKHISTLVQWTVVGFKRTPDFGSSIVQLVAYTIDQKVYALLGRHFFEMKAQ